MTDLTRPFADQVRFDSAKTGLHNLDTYLEDCELGNRKLDSLLLDLFTTGGVLRSFATPAALATAIADATAQATAAANTFDQFDDRYLGSKTSDPTLDNDGAALLTGALYFNSTAQQMRVWNGVSWLPVGTAVPLTITTQTNNGTGAQTAFTLSSAPAFLAALEVTVGGSTLRPTLDYTLSGATVTFVTAPATGTNNIFFRWFSPTAGGVPNDGSVTTPKFDPNAVAPFSDSGVTQAEKTANVKVATTAFVDRLRSLSLGSNAGAGVVIANRGDLVICTGNPTIPSGIFAGGDIFTLYNNTAGNLTITQGSGLTLRLVGTATTGSRTLAQRGLVTVTFINTNEAVISGGGLT